MSRLTSVQFLSTIIDGCRESHAHVLQFATYQREMCRTDGGKLLTEHHRDYSVVVNAAHVVPLLVVNHMDLEERCEHLSAYAAAMAVATPKSHPPLSQASHANPGTAGSGKAQAKKVTVAGTERSRRMNDSTRRTRVNGPSAMDGSATGAQPGNCLFSRQHQGSDNLKAHSNCRRSRGRRRC